MRILIFLVIMLTGGGLGLLLGYKRNCASGACALTATPRRGLIFGLIFGALTAAAFLYSGLAGFGPPVVSRTGTPVATPAELEKALSAAPGLVILDFGASWCIWCRRLTPVLDEVVEGAGGKLRLITIDIDRSPALAKQFNVDGIPHLALLRDGKVLDASAGYMNRDELQAWLGKYLTPQPATPPAAGFPAN